MTKLQDALTTLDQFIDQRGSQAAITFHRGVEREALRVSRNSGRISQAPHPKALGSALTHPSITTDYSEALMEFITGVHDSVEDVIDELSQIHLYTNQVLDSMDECLWPGSMPCALENNAEVPIAYFGESNSGKLKRVYREGLSNRYGRIMQCIAGMHYNFSFSDEFWTYWADFHQVDISTPERLQAFKSEQYFALIRNFRRKSWILSLLFGASPAIDTTFLDKKPAALSELGSHTWAGNAATSLRMSNIGYQNKAQDGLFVCYNDVSTYIDTIKGALRTPYPAYQTMGVKIDNDYKQLSHNILQIENEYYSDIRPKRVTQSGEHPSAALQRRGVEYIEVRIMDLDPNSPIGMQTDTLYFLDTFLMCCMLHGDEKLGMEECQQLRKTQQEIATHGRELDTTFDFGFGHIPLKEKANDVLSHMQEIANFLSNKTGNRAYVDSVAAQRHKLQHPETLPAARLLKQCEAEGSYQAAMLQEGKRQQQQWLKEPLPEKLTQQFEQWAIDSVAEQEKIEANDEVDFDTFLEQYMRPQ
ncbi:glutamate--cysteine ligase [Marinomonas piezotolerans]|uniref:Glutamate--cysteine ligase n=1 Tax=Marinomonas piezotolerans TaxID=2213058 RepID=A0A370U6F1_9GAMM|nr:glutamate--cysteine ligase [Marinomonas piezotolerans]RDL43356.1 glutamate--cysteine ligase [Marinomonas piezotolerans]